MDILLPEIRRILDLFINYNGFLPRNAVIGSIVFLIPTFIISGLYRTVIRFSSWPEILGIARGILIYGICFFILSIIRVEEFLELWV